MYVTKRFNKNSDTGFNSVGAPYVQAKPNALLDPTYVSPKLQGKQFQTNPLGFGGMNGLFTKYDFKGEPYVDRVNYLSEQPREARKNGFGSQDAFKRSEFCQLRRSMQFREITSKENKWMSAWQSQRGPSKSRERTKGRRPRSKTTRGLSLPPIFQETVPSHLFDIGKSETGTTQHCFKCPRDMFFCKHRVEGKGVKKTDGHRRPSYVGQIGYGSRQPSKREFGASQGGGRHARISYTKEFFDQGHLHTAR
eukprot:173435_1